MIDNDNDSGHGGPHQSLPRPVHGCEGSTEKYRAAFPYGIQFILRLGRPSARTWAGGEAANNSSSTRAASSNTISAAPAYPRIVLSSPGSATIRD
jgi:hypothetical protein